MMAASPFLLSASRLETNTVANTIFPLAKKAQNKQKQTKNKQKNLTFHLGRLREGVDDCEPNEPLLLGQPGDGTLGPSQGHCLGRGPL